MAALADRTLDRGMTASRGTTQHGTTVNQCCVGQGLSGECGVSCSGMECCVVWWVDVRMTRRLPIFFIVAA